MNDLVFKGNDNQALTNSLIVAERFGKDHKNILRDIRNIIGGLPKIEHTPMFAEATYTNAQNGQEYPMFVMNRDGFTLLAMGFTGERALQFKVEYIAAFNKMEKIIKNGGFQVPQTFSEALMLAARQQKIIEEQKKQIEQKNRHIKILEPKASFAENAFDTKDKVDVGMAAKILNLGFGRNTLFRKMRETGIFFGSKNEPKQRYIDARYFELTEKPIYNNSGELIKVVVKVLVTQKGLAYINHLFGGRITKLQLMNIQ